MVVAERVQLDTQRPFKRLPGPGQLPELFQDKGQVAQVDGKLGVVWPALAFAQRDCPLEKGPRRRQVPLFGENIAEIGQVRRNGGIVCAIDRQPLVENELKQRAGTSEIAPLHERNGLFREIWHVAVLTLCTPHMWARVMSSSGAAPPSTELTRNC